MEQHQQMTDQELDEQQLIAEFAEVSMTPMQAFWIKVAVKAKELDPIAAGRDDAIRKLNPQHKNQFLEASREVIWLVSKKNPLRRTNAGRIFTATPYNAARCLVNDTHDLATDDQIARYNREMASRRVEADKIKAQSQPVIPAPIVNVTLSPEESKAIRESRKPSPPASN
jgi:hypothetical protein